MPVEYNERHHLDSFRLDLDYCTGRVIRQLRSAKKITGEELGGVVGYSQQQISRYERGCCQFTLKAMSKFSDGLGITLWSLLDEVRLFYIISQIDDAEYRIPVKKWG